MTSSLYLLVGNAIRGRLIVHARVSDQERGRLALTWIADRLRQVDYDEAAVCPEGFLRLGAGGGFGERLAFRAVIDESQMPPRRTYVYYLDEQTIWQEVLDEEGTGGCSEELERAAPLRSRAALIPPIVQGFRLQYLDAGERPTVDPARARLIRISLTVRATGAGGRLETLTYDTAVAVRGP